MYGAEGRIPWPAELKVLGDEISGKTFWGRRGTKLQQLALGSNRNGGSRRNTPPGSVNKPTVAARPAARLAPHVGGSERKERFEVPPSAALRR